MASEDDEPRSGVLDYAVLRPLLFVFWSLVLWGTLALVAWIWQALTKGPAATLALALRTATADVWGVLNVALPAVAAVVWTAIALLAWSRPREGNASRPD